MTVEPEVLFAKDASGVARLTLNRPAARNALSLGVMHALRQALADAAMDPGVKVVILAGNGAQATPAARGREAPSPNVASAA
jgi:enoyl-CoA hydratase/carnithine racemase